MDLLKIKSQYFWRQNQFQSRAQSIERMENEESMETSSRPMGWYPTREYQRRHSSRWDQYNDLENHLRTELGRDIAGSAHVIHRPNYSLAKNPIMKQPPAFWDQHRLNQYRTMSTERKPAGIRPTLSHQLPTYVEIQDRSRDPTGQKLTYPLNVVVGERGGTYLEDPLTRRKVRVPWMHQWDRGISKGKIRSQVSLTTAPVEVLNDLHKEIRPTTEEGTAFARSAGGERRLWYDLSRLVSTQRSRFWKDNPDFKKWEKEKFNYRVPPRPKKIITEPMAEAQEEDQVGEEEEFGEELEEEAANFTPQAPSLTPTSQEQMEEVFEQVNQPPVEEEEEEMGDLQPLSPGTQTQLDEVLNEPKWQEIPSVTGKRRTREEEEAPTPKRNRDETMPPRPPPVSTRWNFSPYSSSPLDDLFKLPDTRTPQ